MRLRRMPPTASNSTPEGDRCDERGLGIDRPQSDVGQVICWPQESVEAVFITVHRLPMQGIRIKHEASYAGGLAENMPSTCLTPCVTRLEYIGKAY